MAAGLRLAHGRVARLDVNGTRPARRILKIALSAGVDRVSLALEAKNCALTIFVFI